MGVKRGDLSKGLPPDNGSPGGRVSRPRPAKDFEGTAEADLIDAAVKQDIEAFAHLFERYRPDLYGLCLRRLKDSVGNSSLAEDVVQDVFIRAFKNLPSFDRSKPFWPWLATIAARMCIDLQRHRALTQYSEDIGVSVDPGRGGQTISALDETIASEERALLQGWLSTLPQRQRRALLLHVWDGWSYEDIAAAEGISVSAVRMLLVRARKKMRMRARRALPSIVFPFTWLRWKLQRMEERIHPLLGFHGEGWPAACMQAACLGALALMVAGTNHPAVSLDDGDAIRSEETVLSATRARPLQTASLPMSPRIAAPTKAPVESQQSVVDPASSLADDVINLNQNVTPEQMTIHSISVSPNYESDHTILFLGSGRVLFVSHDGGANWKPLPSLLLSGTNMVLSPRYPQDRRVFVLGDLGLQKSDDGGEIFRTVSPFPLGSSLAISPSFGREDSKVLIGGKTLFEYDAGTGVTVPASLPIAPSLGWGNFFITFSPGYEWDRTIFVSHPGGIPYRCNELTCKEMSFPRDVPLNKLRLSPRFDQDGLAYAFTYTKLLASNDGARTFQEIPFPLPNRGWIVDIAILWNRSSDPAIFTYVSSKSLPGLYRSFDAGSSWNRTSLISLPGFGNGDISNLIVAPTGRLLATGGWGGIACSEDFGETWALRCPPE